MAEEEWPLEAEANITFSNSSIPGIPINPSINKCNYFVNNANQTVVFEFTNPYGGIPQNLAFNAIGWVGLIIIFAILRRAAGNYGRLVRISYNRFSNQFLNLKSANTMDC